VLPTPPQNPAPGPATVPPPVLPTTPPGPTPGPAALPAPPPTAVGPTVPGPPVRPPAAARPAAGVPRQISIVPRSSAPIQSQSFPQPNGETAVVVTSGVILTIRSPGQKVGLLDIEADRLVFWTRGGESDRLLGQLRSPQGQTTRHLEFYLAGNVEIREQTPQESHLLRADEVYYDVSRNVAIALKADLEFRRPLIPDPIHFRGEEMYRLSTDRYRVLNAEIFSSRLPSDPGLKVVVAEATLEEKKVPRTSIFGRQFVDRTTGQPVYETQELFESRNVIFRLSDVPVFYLPYLKGDANEPLGPLKNISFGENRIFGFEAFTTFKMYDLLGMTRVPGTNWDLHVDYLSQRGPALGTNFDYAGKNLFDISNSYVGTIRAYGINDTGKDILGGGRGEFEQHPEWRGRLFWQQNVLDLPCGFSVQTQLSALSDKNFLEQYYPREFNNDPNQETYLYVKQQQNNWAWTGLVEPRIRRWVTETEALPRFDGYVLGQSFFDLFTYNVHASAGYFQLRTTEQAPPPFPPQMPTDVNTSTGRFDLWQEISLPFTLGPFRVVPYAVLDLTYYTEDLEGTDRGRTYGAGGVRSSMPLTRLYPDVHSDLFNLNGINHKIVLSSNYFNAKSDTPHTMLPQLDRLDDDATDQARRDFYPALPAYDPGHALFLDTSPLFNPQLYALRRLVDNRIDTLDTIEVFQGDIRQRWQTKRGYPGQEHIIDWMTLDLSGSFFPHSNRDNFGESFGILQYDWTWNIGDRTALVSSGWMDPGEQGPRVFTVGAYLNRPDRTNFFIGYREIDLVKSQAVTGSVTYVFSPKYAFTMSSTYDFGNSTSLANTFMLTRIGSDFQVSLGITYNAILNNFGFTFQIIPNLVPPNKVTQGMSAFGPGLLGR
jgi:hypothetical protein